MAGQSGSSDGTGAQARFAAPEGVAVDTAGNVYVADTGNHTIRKVTSAGLVSTVAGRAGETRSDDGTGAQARFGGCSGSPTVCRGPAAVAVDRDGVVYVADTGNFTIRRIDPNGTVTTLAGTAGNAGSTDGSGADARFGRCLTGVAGSSSCLGPTGIAADGSGNLYAADRNSHTVRKIAAGGAVTTLAGSSGLAGTSDGVGGQARFNFPYGVGVDGAGNVYVADTENHTIRKIGPSGQVSTLAGSPGMQGLVDGSGAQARFGACVFVISIFFDCTGPTALTTDGAGNVYAVDRNNRRIRRITPTGAVTTLETASDLNLPEGIALDGGGNIFIADTSNHVVRRLSPAGILTTFPGSVGESGSVDGAGLDARFSFPGALAFDADGNLYVIDKGNFTIRKITSVGVVTTLAGTAGQSGSADGFRLAASFRFAAGGIPYSGAGGLAIDGAGNVYVADHDNHTLRRITPSGAVSTIAGSAGESGSADGTGSAARFFRPDGIAIDRFGNLYVADSFNSAIRKVTRDGSVTTVVGIAGRPGFLPGSLPGLVSSPLGVAVSGSTLYLTMSNGVAVVRDLP